MLKITVSGYTRDGRTTLAQVIQKALTEHGIPCAVSDSEIPDEDHFQHRVAAVGAKLRLNNKMVTIDVQSLQCGGHVRIDVDGNISTESPIKLHEH